MSIPLKLVAANDTVTALLALADALAAKQAVFITGPETNGLMPEVHSLSDSVDDQIALIVESSGSTGTPKRISISRDALLASAKASEAALGGQGQWLLALPINFIAGANVLIRSLIANTQPVIMNAQLPFTPEAFSRAASLMSESKRFTSLVPVQLQRLLTAANQDEFLLSQLQNFDAVLVGGQAVSASLLEQAKAASVNVVVSYGMSETSGGCVYDGKPLDGVEVRLSENSKVEIRGNVLAESVASDSGWFQTQDLGEFDADGNLRILGRANRVLNSGGLKVSLDAIESVAATVAGVVEVAAISVEDSTWGERAALVYVGSPEVADYLAAEALSELGPAAKPVRIIRVDEIPKLTNSKTDYLSLSKLF